MMPKGGFLRACALLTLAGLIPPPATAQQWEEEEEPKTQVLALPPEPPAVTIADASRLVFDVSPLSPRGLLSKQTLNSLKALFKRNKKHRIVRLRAFVAGGSDTRRVQSVVSEFFSSKRLPLPALSVLQVGPLPAEGAQVVMELVAESRKEENPNGLVFFSGQAAASGEPVLEVAPLARQAVEKVRAAASGLGLDPKQHLLRATCYCSSLDDGSEVRKAMVAAFPHAALNYVQLRRVYTHAAVTCEAVGRLQTPPSSLIQHVNPAPLEPADGRSQAVLVAPGRLAFTSAQLAFRFQESDVRLAFERLQESLAEAKAPIGDVIVARFYTLSAGIGDMIRKIRFDFFPKDHPPASTLVEIDGLPSLDASFAIDVIAPAR